MRESGIEREFGLQLTPNDQEVVDLGTKVVGIDVLYNVRSRNVQVTVKEIKTKYKILCIHGECTDLTAYAVPKYLPVVMTRGSFSTGDLMYSVENSTRNSWQTKYSF